MNAYIKRDDVLKALIRTEGLDFASIISAMLDLPIVDLDEKDREIEKVRESYIAHLKQDCIEAHNQIFQRFNSYSSR